MDMKKIYIIEDDPDVLELLDFNLRKEGFKVISNINPIKALETMSKEQPDFIILDIMLPEIDGFEVCRQLKSNSLTSGIPIIMLTAKGEESDIIVGLELGANDYMTKPFSFKVLIAKVRSLLRQKLPIANINSDNKSVVKLHGLELHEGRHLVVYQGERIDLTTAEFKLLSFLMRRPGWVFSRYDIIDNLYGKEYSVTDRSIDVQCVGLRKKLGHAGQYIETVRGVGYRFRE